MSDEIVICSSCSGTIEEGAYLTVENDNYHKECWRCTNCNKKLDEYHTEGNQAYCVQCYFDLHGEMCKSCNKRIHGSSMHALGVAWHKECLNCRVCNRSLVGEDMWDVGGFPRCEDHCDD